MLGRGIRSASRQLTRVLKSNNDQTTDQHILDSSTEQAHCSNSSKPVLDQHQDSSSSSSLDTDKLILNRSSPKKELHNSFQVCHLHTMPPDDDSTYTTLDKLSLLNKDHIRIKDPARVNQLLSTVIHKGFDKLQLVVDFDYTLTRVKCNGKPCHCSWGILDNSTAMPSFYRDEANKLLEKYYPIEIDPKLTEDEKIPHMVEWYNQVYKLLTKCNVSKHSLKEMVANSTTRLREGTEELFDDLYKHSVPTLIFSAGMGDVLEHVLLHFNVYTSNVKVVSNFFNYNDQGIMTGFKGDLLHVFNKNENAIHKTDYFNQLSNRDSVILMGDSLGDIKMSHGLSQPNDTIKIGFLNAKIEERLDSYMAAFDIVLIDDQTMDVAQSIVGQMQ